MKHIQDAEDAWLYDNTTDATWLDVIRGIGVGLLIACVTGTILAQVYMWGQRNPSPTKFVTYAAAIALANEREVYGAATCK